MSLLCSTEKERESTDIEQFRASVILLISNRKAEVSACHLLRGEIDKDLSQILGDGSR